MRALVISGGGSKGAFGGGVAQYLIADLGREYDIFVGTSTGSLLIPSLAVNQIDNIKRAYTSVTQNDIYNVCPFIVKRDADGNIKTSIHHRNILRMFLRGKKTFGDHQHLLQTIRRTVLPEHFEELKSNNKKVIISVANLTLNIIEYKYAFDCSYEEFTEWMWASCSFIPFMGMVHKHGYDYADGGFGSPVPIEEAINAGATEIDVIVLNPRFSIPDKTQVKNAFDVLLKAIDFMFNRIVRHDIYIGHLQSVYDDSIKVNFVFTPRVLTEHSFVFYPDQMMAWWEEGYEYARQLYGQGQLG